MIDSSLFSQGWRDVVTVLVLAPLGYAALVVMLRLSRKRTLAHMNIFDFVYVIVIGNVLAMTILDDNISFVKGLTALAALIGLQVVVSWLTTKSKAIEHVVNGEPALLFHRGRFLRDTMHGQRVTEEEVLAAVRVQGVADLEEVEAVVLENDGEFSVIHFGEPRRESTLRDVPGIADLQPRDAARARAASR